MMVIRFRSKEDHKYLLDKVKKMRKFTEEIEECLADAYDEIPEYRNAYRHDYKEEDSEREGRYSYRRGSM